MILTKQYEHYYEIILDRPDLHNAFNPEMIAAITNAFKTAASNLKNRYIILKANGKSFCAGGDLNWMKSMMNYSESENQKDACALFEMFEAIYSCPMPTICYGHGNIMGGGIGLIAACDIVLLEQNAKLAFTEVKWGLVPATIGPFVMRKINASQALDLMLSARTFLAGEAKQISLAHFVGSEAECLEQLKTYDSAFKNNAPEAVRKCKEMIAHINHKNVLDVKTYTTKLIAACRVGAEGQAGLNLFLNKQKVYWSVD